MKAIVFLVDPTLSEPETDFVARSIDFATYRQVWAIGKKSERIVRIHAADKPMFAAYQGAWRNRDGTFVQPWDATALRPEMARAFRTAMDKGWKIEAAVASGERVHGDRIDGRLDVQAVCADLGIACRDLSPPDISGIPAVWIDCETNGLNFESDPIVEIAATEVDTGHRRVVRRFERKIRLPDGVAADPVASAINGYNDDGWADAPSEKQVMHDLLRWLPARFAWCGFNTLFDMCMVTAAFARSHITLDGMVDHCVDPLPVARKMFRGLRNYRLDTLCSHLGISNLGAHRAMADCERARRVYLNMINQEPIHD